MRPLLTRTFHLDASAPRLARESLGGLPTDRDLDLSSLRLLVSELVSNSLRHSHLRASAQIELAVLETDDRIRVQVKDPGNGYEDVRRALDRLRGEPALHELPSEGGFGLGLVASFSDRYGVLWDEGTVVWFEVETGGRPEI